METTKDTVILIKLLNQINKTSLAIYASRKAVYRNIYIPYLNFPIPEESFSKHIKKIVTYLLMLL